MVYRLGLVIGAALGAVACALSGEAGDPEMPAPPSKERKDREMVERTCKPPPEFARDRDLIEDCRSLARRCLDRQTQQDAGFYLPACLGSARADFIRALTKPRVEQYLHAPPPPPAPVQKMVVNIRAYDGRGRPLGGVRIRVTGPVTVDSLADQRGYVDLRLPAGDYTVTAEVPGFKSSEQPLHVEPGAVFVRPITLTPR